MFTGSLSGVDTGQHLRRVVLRGGGRLPKSFVGVLVRSFFVRVSLKLPLCSL